LAVAFVSLGVITAFVAGIAALVAGQPWWIALAAYAGVGTLTVILLAAAHVAASALAPLLARLSGAHTAPAGRGN
jgi:hypothetical protein